MHFENVDCSINTARPSSVPTLITPSSTVRAVDIAMPVTSKMLIFLVQSEHRSLIESNWQVARLKSPRKEWLSICNKFYLSPLVCINPKPLSSIIGNTDIDFLNPHCPTSPPNAPVLNVCWGTEVTVACEIPLNLLAIKLIWIFIICNPTADQGEGPVQGAVDSLQHPSPILTGSCLLQIFIFCF